MIGVKDFDQHDGRVASSLYLLVVATMSLHAIARLRPVLGS